MSTSSEFNQLANLTNEELYKDPETKYGYSWDGHVFRISDDDIEHLKAGKPLQLIVDEYNVVIAKS